MNHEEMNDELERVLREAKLIGDNETLDVAHPANMADAVLIIRNYRPKASGGVDSTVSFGFPLTPYYEDRPNNNKPPMRNVNPYRKCWITHDKVKPIGVGRPPNPHSEYKEFCHEGQRYYPYSVDLGEYILNSPDSIKSLCERLYAHIDFDSNV